ncbi:hypothetical protein ACC745_38220, partial [Rhizobium ruizarguesonis]
RKVAVLDVDFHHGNGTQDLFYHRGYVFTASLHGDPMHAFPYFLGHADEEGEVEVTGANRNYPMPPGTPFVVIGKFDSEIGNGLELCRADL